MRDVIVVGAGPAGCTAASLLAREGVRVLLLDKSAAPPPKICGEYLSPGCLPILSGIGVLHSLRDAGARPLHGMAIHTAAGRTLEATYSRDSDVTGFPLHGLSVRRAVLDPMLLDRAVKDGAEFEPNNRRDFTPTTDPTRFLLETAATLPGLRDRLAHAHPIGPVCCLGPLAYRGSRLEGPSSSGMPPASWIRSRVRASTRACAAPSWRCGAPCSPCATGLRPTLSRRTI